MRIVGEKIPVGMQESAGQIGNMERRTPSSAERCHQAQGWEAASPDEGVRGSPKFRRYKEPTEAALALAEDASTSGSIGRVTGLWCFRS